jgi:hypothetical protein
VSKAIETGRTLRFDGVNDYVTMGDQALHTFSTGAVDTAFTIEAWVYLESNTLQGMITKSSTAATGEYNISIDNNGYPKLVIVDNTGTGFFRCIGSTPVTLNQWFHIAFTYDGSAVNTGTKLYVNGVRDLNVVQSSGGGAYTRMRDTTEPLLFGAYYGSGTPSTFLSGKLDEVRLWNIERTSAQIAANYAIYVSTGSTGLIGYWKLDETSGTTANDSTTNAKHGTLTNGPLWRPYDGFDLYTFNAGGTQIATDLTWQFEGV